MARRSTRPPHGSKLHGLTETRAACKHTMTATLQAPDRLIQYSTFKIITLLILQEEIDTDTKS